MNDHQTKKRETTLRWCFFLVGIIILSLGISMTMQVRGFGIGPWDVFHYGLYLQFGLSVGTWSIIAGLMIIIISAFIQKKVPQIGTLLNMMLIGVFIDFFNWLLPEPELFFVKVLGFIFGTIIIALGIGVYVSPNVGAGPRDSLMLSLTNILGWKVSTVRNTIEISVGILGFLLGGPVGIGTLFIALFLGTMVGHTLPLSKKCLKFLIAKGELYEDIYQGTLRTDDYDRASQKLRRGTDVLKANRPS